MQLSQKRNTFPEFVATFLKSKSNSEHFESEDGLQSSCISEIRDCQRRGSINV